MKNLQDRTLALAAIIQAAQLVDRLAVTGEIASTELENSLATLFTFSADSTEAAVGGRNSMTTGLRTLIKMIDSGGQEPAAVTRYLVSINHLERKLAKRGDMLQVIGDRLTSAERQAKHFEALNHPSLLANLAQIYQDTLSTFAHRIQVTGDAKHLQSMGAPDKVRALLLCGIRASWLWHQVGGRRWHLLFYRKQYRESAQQLLSQ